MVEAAGVEPAVYVIEILCAGNVLQFRYQQRYQQTQWLNPDVPGYRRVWRSRWPAGRRALRLRFNSH
jgi:hypothetical protein